MASENIKEGKNFGLWFWRSCLRWQKKEITKCFCICPNFIAIESYILNKLELIALWCSKCQNTKIWSVYFFFFPPFFKDSPTPCFTVVTISFPPPPTPHCASTMMRGSSSSHCDRMYSFMSFRWNVTVARSMLSVVGGCRQVQQEKKIVPT